MEFDIERDRVVGYVAEPRGINARVYAMAIISEDETVTTLEPEQAIKLFPPCGHVFIPSLFNKKEFKLNDIISLHVEKNQDIKDAGLDQFVSKQSISKACVDFFGIPVCELDSENIDSLLVKKTIDLTNMVNCKCPDRDFYGIVDGKYALGKLRKTRDGIAPVVRKRVPCYELEQNNKLVYQNKIVGLIKIPESKYFIVDCCKEKDLFKWFREQLISVDKDYVGLMDKQAKWRTDLPKHFETFGEDEQDICKVRINRIERIADNWSLSAAEVLEFMESSDALRDVFEKAIEVHKEEFKSKYAAELKEQKQEQEDVINKSLSELKHQQKVLKKDINKSKVELDNVESFKEKKIEELEKIKNSKDRILEDFSIIKDVLRIQSNQSEELPAYERSYIVETVEFAGDDIKLASLEEFEKNIQFKLKEYQINPCLAKSLWQVLLFYKMSFIKDVRLGLALAEATNNSKYILTQVEPDWLHFKDFWDNGLGELWQSAHANADVLHFLILEDINLSSPECYARPLLDIVNGVRKHIPYGKTIFPNNLRILMTKASVEDPAIGLPLIQDTFKDNIGFFGFTFDLKVTRELEYEIYNSVLNPDSIIYDEEDKKEVETWSNQNNFWIEE